MDDGEILALRRRDCDARRGCGQRLRGKKGEGQVRDGFPELRAGSAIPGIDFVEGIERPALCRGDAQEVKTGVGDRSGPMGEADERKGGARSPYFRVFGCGGLERGEG